MSLPPNNRDYFFEADNFLRQKAHTVLNASVKWTLLGRLSGRDGIRQNAARQQGVHLGHHAGGSAIRNLSQRPAHLEYHGGAADPVYDAL